MGKLKSLGDRDCGVVFERVDRVTYTVLANDESMRKRTAHRGSHGVDTAMGEYSSSL